MKALIEMTTIPEQTVLDPFCGSGTTLVAALQLGRQYIGIEMGNEYYNVTLKRIQAEKDSIDNSLFNKVKVVS